MTFLPKLDTLPAPQRELWSELKATPKHFVLYGGTALALRLGHRESEDFDFFTNEKFEPGELVESVPYLRDGRIRAQSENTVTVILDRKGSVPVSFFGGLGLSRVSDPEAANDSGVLVASLLDIAGCKMAVVQRRAESKDYRDITAILESGISLAEAISAAKAIYGVQFEPEVTLRALSYFADGDLPKLPFSMQNALR